MPTVRLYSPPPCAAAQLDTPKLLYLALQLSRKSLKSNHEFTPNLTTLLHFLQQTKLLPFSSSSPRAQDFVFVFLIMAEESDVISNDEPITDAIEPEFDVVSDSDDDIEAPLIRKFRPRQIKTNNTDETCAPLAVSKDTRVKCEFLDKLWASRHPRFFTLIRTR